MAQETDNYTDYPMFKGLQRPLEFMGLQGRYITWAAITAAVGILGFMLVYALTGFIIGLAFAVLSISTGVGIIMVKVKPKYDTTNGKLVGYTIGKNASVFKALPRPQDQGESKWLP